MKLRLAPNALMHGIKKMIKYLLSLSLIATPMVHAEVVTIVPDGCAKVTEIKKGEAAPCDGFYFPDWAEKEAAESRDDAEYLKKVNDELTRKSQAQAAESEILERRLNLYMQQSDVLSKDVARRDNTESLYRVLYFGLGALLTGYIASNVGH